MKECGKEDGESHTAISHKRLARWQSTRVSGLLRWIPSGVYFANFRAGGRVIRKSLGTESETIAKLKLSELMLRERARAGAGDMTFGVAADGYMQSVRAKAGLAQRSVDYREETLGMIRRLWPEIDRIKVADLTPPLWDQWSERALSRYSATRYNGAIQTVKGVLKWAMGPGHPAEHLRQCSVRVTPFSAPSREAFAEMLEKLGQKGNRREPALDMVRFMACTGARINEARHVTGLDIEAGQVRLRKTKNGEERSVPIIPEANGWLPALAAAGKERVFTIDSPRRALRYASERAGIKPPLTPHKLRHIFATRAIESGVDIRTVAGWLGHKDGGALLLKRYAHLVNAHSVEMAKRVRL